MGSCTTTCEPARLALACLLLAALTPGAVSAQDDAAAQAESGAVLRLQSWWVTPRNTDLDFAFIDESGGLSGGGEVQTLTHDQATVPKFYAGWRMGSKAAPEIGVWFWEYDETSSAATGLLPGQVGARLATPDFAIVRSLVDSAAAKSRLRAISVDTVLSWHAHRGEATTVQVGAGVRLFRFEQATTVTYGADNFGQQLEQILTGSTDTDGVGPLVAVSFLHRFGRRVHVGASLGLAAPLGEIQAEATDSAFIDGGFDRATRVVRSGSDRVFVQIDGGLRLDVELAHGWSVGAEYQFQQWSGVAIRDRFVDEVSQNTALSETSDVVFEGFLLGVSYAF